MSTEPSGIDNAQDDGAAQALEGAGQAALQGPPAAGMAPGGGFGARLRRLGSESLIYGLSSVVGRFLSYLLQFLYAHEFTPTQNGIQGVVYTYAPVFSIVFLLGMDVAFMRNTASVKDRSLGERQRAFSMSFAAVAFGGGAILVLALLASPWLGTVFNLAPAYFRFLLLIVYTDALIAVPYANLRMTARAMRYAVLRLLFVVISIALNLVLILGLHWGVTAVFAANLAANLLILAIFLREVFTLFRPRLLRGANWRPLWQYALPIMPAMLAVAIVENGDLMVLNWLPDQVARSLYHMADSKAVVGIYNFNYKLGVAMLLVVQMFRMAWTPFSLQHGKSKDAPLLFSRVLTALMLLCGAVFLGLTLFLEPLSRVPAIYHWPKSPTYWNALGIVPLILLAYIFSGMYAVVTAGLYIERKTKVLPWIAGAGALINVLICIFASRHLGLIAVAAATPCSYILMAMLGAWQSNRVYPVPFEWLRLVHLAAVIGAIFAADRWLSHLGWQPLAGATLGVKVLLLLAYPALLFVTRFFRRGEWNAIRRVVLRRG